MHKLWYTTVILALAAVALGVFFFFVLPRNSPSNGSPIAMLDPVPEDDFFSSAAEEPSSSLSEEFAPPLEQTFQDEDLFAPSHSPQEQLLEQQEFPAYEQANDPPPPPPPAPVPSVPPPRPTPVAAAGRPHTATHTVASGEWFAHITNQYWGDFFLWPDLYTLNTMKSKDPDLIYPGELVQIYQSLVDDDILDAQEKKVLMKAYLSVYRTYKDIGPNKNQSIWRLLYSATRYEPFFLDIYQQEIDPQDRKMAEQLVQESRYID